LDGAVLRTRRERRTSVTARRLAAGAAATAAAIMICAQPIPALAGPTTHAAHAAPTTHAAPAASQTAGPAGVDAWGAELADAATGRRLWSRMPFAKRPIGSITKVMTALLVIQAGNLNRKITVTRAAVSYVRSTGASNAGLVAGDVLTARQLLEAMLVPSGCDAAFLLATTYGPGRGAFVRKMNAEARTLGLRSTHFAHFDGMPIPNEHATYSTPSDLIRLAEQAMRYPVFRNIVAQRRHFLAATAQHHRYFWKSTNKLLGTYRGAIGIKTGTTRVAGACLLFAARRGSRTLIGVVLHAIPTASVTSRFTAARRMLNWGFRQH
jgi:serine-type D-Ala-D-Ala carboxypeptidase (penicillin-binding protein 5/6)